MTVEQVGRTKNSVTINVSGITEGDRSTSIWVPTKEDWFTLHEARDYGYIKSFSVVDLVSNNGDITVTINKTYFPYKVIYLKVENLRTSTGDIYIQLATTLKFLYDYSFPKITDTDIDITVSDILQINMFAGHISKEAGWFIDSDIEKYGDNIRAVYLTVPATLIYNTAYNDEYLNGTDRSAVLSNSSIIINNVKSGADFEARYFNFIESAINNYNQSITYP